MTQSAEPEELVGFGGGPDRPPRRSFTRWMRRRPWLVAVVAVVVVIGAGVAFAINRSYSPDLPTLSARSTQPAVVPAESTGPFPWAANDAGRPSSTVQLRDEAQLTFATSVDRLDVFGVAGPGVSTSRKPLRSLGNGARTMLLSVDTPVDCEQVPLPVPPDAYGVAVRVIDSSRGTSGTVSAGAVGRRWASAVQAACASWLARTHLTMSTATVAVDPSRPRATVSTTITNDGDRDAFVRAVHPPNSGEVEFTTLTTPPGVVRVPAHGSAALSAALTIDSCDALASIQTTGSGTDAPVPVTSDVIDLYSSVGTQDGLSAPPPSYTTGYGPTGVLLSPAAATAMSKGLNQACGGVDGFAVFVAPHGATYDAASKVLTVRLVIDAPPRTIHDLTLTSSKSAGDQAATPLSTAPVHLVPDRTGQVTTTLRYRPPANCLAGELFLPGFGLAVRTPATAGANGYRTVHFSHFGVQWQDAAVQRQVCPD